MLEVRTARRGDAPGIVSVCSAGWRDTDSELYAAEEIEATIAEFYNLERVRKEIANPEN